jgi:hypothetical protein
VTDRRWHRVRELLGIRSTVDMSVTPGSPEALIRGCTCSGLANDAGAGHTIINDRPVFLISFYCRLHCPPQHRIEVRRS